MSDSLARKIDHSEHKGKVYDTTVRIRPFRQGATMPEAGTDLAAGRDVRAWVMKDDGKGKLVSGELTIAPGDMAPITTGLNIRLAPGWECQVRPRSGLAFKNQVTVMNSPGTIDADYDGDGEPFEIKVLLKNTGKEPFVVKHGDRIAQLVVKEVPRVQWVLDEGDNTKRNQSNRDGGFGHTGVK